MFDELKLMARLSVPVARLKQTRGAIERAFDRRDYGRIADLIDRAIPDAETVRDVLREHAAKLKPSERP